MTLGRAWTVGGNAEPEASPEHNLKVRFVKELAHDGSAICRFIAAADAIRYICSHTNELPQLLRIVVTLSKWAASNDVVNIICIRCSPPIAIKWCGGCKMLRCTYVFLCIVDSLTSLLSHLTAAHISRQKKCLRLHELNGNHFVHSARPDRGALVLPLVSYSRAS